MIYWNVTHLIYVNVMSVIHSVLRNYVAHAAGKIKHKKLSLSEKVVVLPLCLYRWFRGLFKNSNNKITGQLYMSVRKTYTTITNRKHHFVSSREMACDIDDWITTFPQRYDLIIGVPRSGLMVANIIALRLARSLATPDMDAGKFWVSHHMVQPEVVSEILLVDDSITTGVAMRQAYTEVQRKYPHANITTATLYATDDSKNLVDLYYRLVPVPRVFEWNILHSKRGITAVDLDGLLCGEVTHEDTKNPDAYLKFISEVRPYLIPSYCIDAIITNRLEGFRSQTETWLVRNGVKYTHLYMKPENVDFKDKFEFKINMIRRVKPLIYLESRRDEAEAVASSTGVSVYCAESHEFYE